ncbi:large ribosomal subunit protein uL29m [Dermacentor andersoni]|uniref:large ribosomal subunit protein uL29m n=1 Tax=Dermacentor andersoni TaxID=34620 RepID=UPI003B3AA7E9
MSSLNKCAGLCKLLFSGVATKSSVSRAVTLNRIAQSSYDASLHTSCAQHGLMEFFEPKDNWGADEVRSGKPWSKDELRIKSNSDLHKLWYILLKEKNMLLTMEEAAKREVELFPNPERIDKVKESMDNLEEVVRERNEAYYLLETGESGEQPWTPKENIYGFVCNFALKEHLIPRKSNPKGYFLLWRDKDLDEFLRLYREKMQKRKEFHHRMARNRIMQIIKRFPTVDRALLREQYPDVDIDKLERIVKEKIYVAYEQQTE